MGKGMQTLLESAAPTLVLAVVVLAGGMGYGFYKAHNAPAEEATPAAVEVAPGNAN